MTLSGITKPADPSLPSQYEADVTVLKLIKDKDHFSPEQDR